MPLGMVMVAMKATLSKMVLPPLSKRVYQFHHRQKKKRKKLLFFFSFRVDLLSKWTWHKGKHTCSQNEKTTTTTIKMADKSTKAVDFP